MMKSFDRTEFLLTAAGLFLFGPRVFAALSNDIYVVKKGDTLTKIATAYGISVREIKRINGISNDLIVTGQSLKIPKILKPSESLKRVKEVTNSVRTKPRKWKYIVGHHSAIASGNAEIYDRNHRRRGMKNGLAYHFVIGNGIDSGNGEIEIGNRWLEQLDGGHVRRKEVNQRGIGICVVGNFEETRPTRNQVRAFIELVSYLGNHFLEGNYKFLVHREVDRNHTVCPGKFFPTQAMHRRFG